MLNVALTHDVDRIRKSYQYFTHSIRSLKKGDLQNILYQISSLKERKNVYWNFDKIINIENSYNVKSTFFFLNETISLKTFVPGNWKLALGRYDISEPKIRNIITYLSENGWEIGLHGSFLSYNNKELLKNEKTKLESIIKQDVAGIRQHYLNFDESTWRIQKELGFKYDSTWGFTRQLGFKENKYIPFHPTDDYFTVFPMVIMDAAYMMMSKSDRIEKLENIIETCMKHKSVLVINWHSNNYNEIDYPGFMGAYIEIIEQCLRYNARFDVLKNFYSEL